MVLKDGSSTLSTSFMGSCKSYSQADVIIVGVPMDYTASFKPGARFGPRKIREVSAGIEEYSFYQNISLEGQKYFDCGDLDLPFDVEKSLLLISKAAEEIFNDEKFPLFIGGEHLISTPVIQKAYEKYGDELILLHFDAHADLREDYLGCQSSHACAIRRVAELIPGKNIYQFGIRSGTKEEYSYGFTNTNFYMFDVAKPLMEVIEKLKNKPVYVTLDIDVVDPAFANGTGTPEPGGITSSEMIKAILMLKNLDMVGFDIVEVAPPYDISDRTSLLAAKIIREIILIANTKYLAER